MRSSNVTDHSSSASIEFVELSVQNLEKNFHKRKKWESIFNPEQHQHQNVASWRTQLAEFLESTLVRVITILFLLVDLVITILELSSSLISRISTKKIAELVWYHWVSMGILGLLATKTLALAFGLGSAFFRRPGYVIDGAVVVVALFLEAFLESKGGGLVVVASLWRVVRVVESAFELSDEAIESQIEEIQGKLEEIKEENRRLLEKIDEKDMIIEKLQEELDECRHASDNLITIELESN